MRDIVMPPALSISETHFRRVFFWPLITCQFQPKKLYFFPSYQLWTSAKKKKSIFRNFVIEFSGTHFRHMSKFFLHNSKAALKKSWKRLCLIPSSPKWSSWLSKVGQMSNKSFNFRAHLSTFRLANTPKSRSSKTENNI